MGRLEGEKGARPVTPFGAQSTRRGRRPLQSPGVRKAVSVVPKERGVRFRVLGAGMMGCATVYDLACSKRVAEIVVGDFDLPRAEEVARKYGGGKARAVFVDVRKPEETAKLVAGGETGLNWTQYYWNLKVMKAAVEARVEYLGFGGVV